MPVVLVSVWMSGCAEVGTIEVADGTYYPVERERTVANSSVVYPSWLFDKPEHYEFSTAVSNHDPKHQHPAQWAGQEWDPAMWNAETTPEAVLRRLYAVRVFSAQYQEKATPVLEVGPTFWKVSDQDRRRALKLLADHTQVLAAGGQSRIVLRDWYTKDNVGTYDAKGMQLK